jgi:hypothetical protein
MCLLVGSPQILLLYQGTIGAAVPDATPRTICLGKAERKIWLAAVPDFLERALDDAPAVAEPIMPVAERTHAGIAGQLRLRLAYFRHAQIVKAEIGRQMRLPMAGKQRFGLSNIGPFGFETSSTLKSS